MQLTDNSRVIKKFFIADMQTEEVKGLTLPEELESFRTLQLSRGVYLLCGNGNTFLLDGLKMSITRMADALEARLDFGLGLSPCGQFAFAFGGFSKQLNCCLTSVERYTIS